ncbi:DUF1501 domain-containing protein [Actinomycetospora flava]|uniref:DUF1501 domain-containing protein n=1 Tax=Actinomycetospora flava TaxID=3129232 RepID=A0ABU8M6G9_9PSEU
MKAVTRRRFLGFSGVAAGALALGATALPWSDLLAAAARDPRPDGQGVLVVVTLYGGNDGLNTVVPVADPAYVRARPDLAYDPHEVLPLAAGLGLNPGMRGLEAVWRQGRMAVVQGVGYPRPDHSHFRSMAIWQTASPVTPSGAGWLGRWLDATGDDPLRALSLDPVLPPLLVGERSAAATLPLGGLPMPQGRLGEALAALGLPDATDDAFRARVAQSVEHLGSIGSSLAPALAGRTPIDSTELAEQLSLAADLITARVPTRVYSASLGGFDTHADARGTQERLLGVLDDAVAPFLARMAGTPAGRDVVVIVYSEFGRRVQANLSDGTDHGTAGPVFLLGDRVQGGLHGTMPSLTDLDAGDMRPTVDFRDVYATVLDGVLEADADAVLREPRGRLGGLVKPPV